MSKVFQVLEGANNPHTLSLPLSATANDLRGVVQYLRKRPEGVTWGEATDAIKRHVFEPAKINAYISLGVVARSGDRLKLDSLGWQLARALEPELRAFRVMLDQTEPYRTVLNWAHQQEVEVLTHTEVASYWHDFCPEVLGINTTQMIESGVGCFFQLCQAAALGTHIMGKKGQPTRLRLDRDELMSFLVLNQSPEEESHGPARAVASSNEAMQVYVSASTTAQKIARQVQTALDLADINCVVVERPAANSMFVSQGKEMRSCDAGIIILTQEDRNTEQCGLKSGLRIEIGAAHVLYDERLILLCDASLRELEDFHRLRVCEIEEGNLTLDAGARVTQMMKEFRRSRELSPR